MFHFRSSYRKAPPQVLLENHFCLNIEGPRRYCRAIPSSQEKDLPPGCFPPLAPAHLSHIISTDRSHHHSHPTRPSKGSRAALVGARGARTSSKPTHTPRPRSLRSGPVRGTGQGESLQPSPHPPPLQWGAGSPTGPNSAGGAWGKLGGLEASRERVPSRRLQPVCREHPSIRRELRTLRGIRAIGGQHDVRDGAWQELAPPHLSPQIRTTLGQHKFFHVRLQHLFIISTKPQDITASDTLESFQELETEEGFPPAAIPRQRREGFCGSGCGRRLRRPGSAQMPRWP